MNKLYKEIRGIGVHNGEPVNLRIFHAEKGSGITFINTNHPDITIKARPENLKSVDGLVLNTCLAVGYAIVCTTEHLFSALWALGIYDAHFEIDSDEVPILDGSALEFYNLMRDFNCPDNQIPEPFSIKDTIRVEDNDGAYIEATPYDGFKIEFSIDFTGSVIGKQVFAFEQGNDDYAKEIAKARTFGFIKYLPEMQKRGLAFGSSLKNSLAVDFDGKSYINEPQFNDEAVRHKILDLIGDLHIIGKPVKGFFKAHKASHSLNAQLAEKIVSVMGNNLPSK